MAINTDNIIRYNDIMFGIISNALIRDEDIKEKIKKYDIIVVPSIVVDEKHKYMGRLKAEEIKKIITAI